MARDPLLLHCDTDFARWRQRARLLLQNAVEPHQVGWADPQQNALFDSDYPLLEPPHAAPVRISARALSLLEQAARYRIPSRWNLLYRVLWRLHQGDRAALLSGDPDGSLLHQRIKAVSREAHHLHAFLRFHPAPQEHLDWIAWHEPAHDILHSASRHFVHRLGQQRWLIATPVDAVHYDGQTLHFHRHCPADWQQQARLATGSDQTLWHTYYRNIYNPARVNPEVMQGHMPVRFWRQMPEGQLIPQLVLDARHGARQSGQQQDIAQARGKQIRGKPGQPN